MYLVKSHLKWSFILAVFSVMIFATLSDAAAVASHQARSSASNQAAARLGGGGPGSDLRAISNPRTQPQTFTGFPAGTLPGSTGGGGGGGGGTQAGAGGSADPTGKVVFSGDPLSPHIGPQMVGSKLDRIFVIAGHVGYNIVRLTYSPKVIDTPYTYTLMSGNRRVSTLYFDHSMTLRAIE